MKHIPLYTKYLISSDGKQILNTDTNKLIKISPQLIKGKETGYLYCTLILQDNSAKRIAVHRLVALTYLATPSESCVWVNHKDGNRSNNDLSNLEWTTISANIQHSFDVLGRKCKQGSEHHLYGHKATKQTKQLQSIAKVGVNHPKFTGYYIVHHLKYASAPLAAKAWKENTKTVFRKCKAGKIGTEYYFVKVK